MKKEEKRPEPPRRLKGRHLTEGLHVVVVKAKKRNGPLRMKTILPLTVKAVLLPYVVFEIEVQVSAPALPMMILGPRGAGPLSGAPTSETICFIADVRGSRFYRVSEEVVKAMRDPRRAGPAWPPDEHSDQRPAAPGEVSH